MPIVLLNSWPLPSIRISGTLEKRLNKVRRKRREKLLGAALGCRGELEVLRKCEELCVMFRKQRELLCLKKLEGDRRKVRGRREGGREKGENKTGVNLS